MIKYIHDEKGKREAVIIPMDLWQLIQTHFSEIKQKGGQYAFEPMGFEETLTGIDLDIEEELKNIEKDWKKR